MLEHDVVCHDIVECCLILVKEYVLVALCILDVHQNQLAYPRCNDDPDVSTLELD